MSAQSTNLGEPACIINGIQRPTCLKIANDSMFCIHTYNRICIIFLTSTTQAGDGKLYVWDNDNHCIHIFNQDLLFLRTFGSLGTAPGMFNWSDNIDFNSTGQFYMTGYENHHIQCFTSDGQLKWCAWSHGDQPGELNHPNVMQVVGSNIFDSSLTIYS